MIGETVSHYRVLEKLGEGGMGVVYLAEDVVLRRQVAIKTLTTARDLASQHFHSRFLREARAASKLSHPHIATIYDYGETTDGRPYIVMELVRGKTLSALIREERLSIQRTIEIVSEVAEALSEAHRHGLVHRDIKPSNIAINERGSVKVLDFGLAKQLAPTPTDTDASALANTQTREGIILGTPLYLSPEQALGAEIDARSDLFSLGSVLYECITGRPAFAGNNEADICARVIRDVPAVPSELNKNVSPELDRVTMTALAKDPKARYQTADELIADLNAVKTDSRTLHQAVTRIKTNGNTPSANTRTALSNIFRQPRLSIGYVVVGVAVVLTTAFLINRWTRPTLSAPSPEAKQLYDKGLAALQEGSYFKASNHFERAVAIDNKFALAHARWAEALAELDRADKSREEMLNALRLVKDRAALDRSNALYFEAIEATLARDLAGAINAYTEVLKLGPTDVSYMDLGRAYENHDEIETAIKQYQQASVLNPSNPASLLRLGVLYGRRQDFVNSTANFDKAEALYKENVNFEGSAEVYYQRGYLLTQVGKMNEARAAAERSLEVARVANNPYQQVRGLLLLSAISYSTGDTKQAQEVIRQALDLANANQMENLAVQGLLDLGYALMIKRSYDESERYLAQGLDLARRYNERRNEARANLLLGTLYIQREEADKGGPYIDQALTFYRNGDYRRETSRCMLMMGRKQLLKGDLAGAVEILDEQFALSKQVEDPAQLARSQAEIAAALSKQDFYPQALVRYRESYELNKQYNNPLNAAFALLNYADMLARLGRYTEADDALRDLERILSALSDDNNYKRLWTIFLHVIKAQMGLADRDYKKVKSECLSALKYITAENTQSLGTAEIEVKGLLGLAEVYLGSVVPGSRLCEEAVTRSSTDTQLQSVSGDLHLLWAEALLHKGDATKARSAALEAQRILAAANKREREWRAWVFAIRASRLLNDPASEQEQRSRAQSSLKELNTRWGAEAFATYSTRKDVQAYRKLLE